MNASRAASASPGTRCATAGAPPSVSRAASGADAGISWRWTAAPMEPSTAVPVAPPNSLDVSIEET
ncbi:hypothetical protein [Streptomyces thermovulgaris]|uniref:hypothetical protein n=1 Tax=Streptomyces TaxID=1883 RepID=UPI0008335B5F